MTKQPAQEHDVIVVPEAGDPQPANPLIMAAVGVAIALLLGGLVGYLVGRGVGPDDSQLNAQAALAQRAKLAAIHARLDDLRNRFTALDQAFGRSRRQAEVLLASRQELRHRLEETNVTLDQARAQLAASQGQEDAVSGAPLPDGLYIGRVVAVEGKGRAPRLVFDVGGWLKGWKARRAAIADGVIDRGQPLPGHHYFRNRSPAWRTEALAPSASITVWNWMNRGGRRQVGIIRFQQLLLSGAPWAVRAANDPYWITVRGDQVVSAREQRYP